MRIYFGLQNRCHPLSWWSAPMIGCIQPAPIITALPPNCAHRLDQKEESLAMTLSCQRRYFLCCNTIIFYWEKAKTKQNKTATIKQTNTHKPSKTNKSKPNKNEQKNPCDV